MRGKTNNKTNQKPNKKRGCKMICKYCKQEMRELTFGWGYHCLNKECDHKINYGIKYLETTEEKK